MTYAYQEAKDPEPTRPRQTAKPSTLLAGTSVLVESLEAYITEYNNNQETLYQWKRTSSNYSTHLCTIFWNKNESKQK